MADQSVSAVRGRLPARIGALLASPVRGLADVDRAGGGVADAAWLVLLGTVCLRLEDLVRAFIGWRDGSLLTAGRQALMVFAQEVRGPVVMSIIAGLVITVLAGRGRRDPSTDIELGAACYVPFYALVAVFRTIEPEAFVGKLPIAVSQVGRGVALGWFVVMVVLAVRIARRREVRSDAAAAEIAGGPAPPTVPPPADGGRTADPEPSPRPRGQVRWGDAAPLKSPTRERVAVTALAAVLGLALVLNVGLAVRTARTAPTFVLPRIDDRPGALALADLRGQVVLLDFWATWCKPCEAMMKPLHELYAEFHPRGVEFVGINSDGPAATPDEIRAYLKKHPAPYPMVIDEGGEVGGRFNVVALPHMVVLGRDGEIRKIFWGLTTKGELAQALSRAAN